MICSICLKLLIIAIPWSSASTFSFDYGYIRESSLIYGDEPLGVGVTGLVLQVVDESTGVKYAMKRSAWEQKASYSIMNEIGLLMPLRHENVARLVASFSGSEHISMLIEHCDRGSLHQVMDEHPNRRLPEEQAKPIIRQIAIGLLHLHSQNIVHRDIKPANILLTSRGVAKICDFGSAVNIRRMKEGTYGESGTKPFRAPEMLSRSIVLYKYSVDLWSLGVLVYCVLFGALPFPRQSAILAGKFSFPDSVDVSDNAKDLISQLLIVDPNTRINAEQVLLHPWLQDTPAKDST